ncbi:MFS general substrate transporter [Ceratobasidium sp. AG-I]|nr:MFS general substrate transporter [Ceratobasidium sp. AG-I]
MPHNTSENEAFLLSEEHSTPYPRTSLSRSSGAFSRTSDVSGQSDATIRPPPAPIVEPVPPSTKRSKASPWWLLPIVTVTALLYAATIAPRTELLIKLACNELHPDWDLVANTTAVQRNATAQQSSHLTRHSPVRLQFLRHLVPLEPRSHIMTPGTNIMCTDNGDVQKTVARLNTAISTTSGILSVLTTGWWTQLSDRVGRVRIMAISALSGAMVDIVFVAVVRNSDQFPGGYHLLVVSNMIDGLLGGFSTAVATSHAYVSDCVAPTERSRWFSLWSGVIFAGMALGPSFGSFISSYTQNIMIIFYINVVFDLIYTLFVAFVVPESMSPEALRNAAESRRRSASSSDTPWWKIFARKLLVLVAPLGMFLPRTIQKSAGRKLRDWNATFIGLAFALHATNSGSYSFKYQYALKAFAWSSTQMGNWLSLLGFTRALHLTVILPLMLKGIHWLRERAASRKGLSLGSDAHSKAKAVDLLVARASLGADICSYTASALVTTSTAFVGSTVFLSFGGGYPPAIQSLALALTQSPTSTDTPGVNSSADDAHPDTSSVNTAAPDDTGRLLGAMSVVHALCSQILGPTLFGMTFVATVESLPRAIFWLSVILNVGSLLFLTLVRLSRSNTATDDDAEYVLLSNMDE